MNDTLGRLPTTDRQLLAGGSNRELPHARHPEVAQERPVFSRDGPRPEPSPHALAEDLSVSLQASRNQLSELVGTARIRNDRLVMAHVPTLGFLLSNVNRTPSGRHDSAWDMDTPGRRLRDARMKLGISAAQLGERVGRSESAVRNQENGTNGIPPALAAVYGRILNVSPEWILYGYKNSQEQPVVDSVPVVGYVSAGSTLTMYSEGQGPFDYVRAPKISTDQTVAVTIRGGSLGPAFDGATIFYDDVQSPVAADLYGRLCVVGLSDGRVMVKVLRRGEDGRFHLLSNTAEEPLWNEEVLWAAKVTEIRPR